MVSLLSTARNLGVILVDGLSCGLILQICPLQYPQDSVFPHKQCKETPGRSAIACLDYCISLLAGLPASVNKPPQPIQNAVGRLIDNPPKFSHSPSSMTAIGFLLQPASDSRRWCWPSRLSMELHPSSSKHWSDHTPHAPTSALLYYISWPAGTASLSAVATLLCFGTSVVERTPDQCQDSGITRHLLKKTQDSFVQTSPRPCLHDSLP